VETQGKGRAIQRENFENESRSVSDASKNISEDKSGSLFLF